MIKGLRACAFDCDDELASRVPFLPSLLMRRISDYCSSTAVCRSKSSLKVRREETTKHNLKKGQRDSSWRAQQP